MIPYNIVFTIYNLFKVIFQKMKKAVIIGAGPAGLVAAKLSLADGYSVTVFEQESDLGGTWLYSSDPSAHSALYERMITNMPKQLMEYEDFQYKSDLSTFLTGEQVLEYLRKYAEGICVEFDTKVVKVEESDSKDGKWKVRL